MTSSSSTKFTQSMNRAMTHVTPINVLAAVGVLSIACNAKAMTKFLYNTYLRRCNLQKRFQTPQGDAYALITGATAGIGQGYALELAKRGFNLILISRSEAKLQATQKTIQEKYPSVQIKTVVSEADVSQNAMNLEGIVKVASSVPLRIVVNNVGTLKEDLLEKSQESDIHHMIDVNTKYPTLLTRALLPILKKNPKNSSVIINVGSMAGVFHMPYLSVYSATKAYNIAFSHALREELMDDGIEVFTHIPARVVSQMSGFSAPEPGVCLPEETVVGALNSIGLRDAAGWSTHSWLSAIGHLLPVDMMGRMSFNEMKAAAEKREQQGKQTSSQQ